MSAPYVLSDESFRALAACRQAAEQGRDRYKTALESISALSSDEPEEEDYDDTESAYNNGWDVGVSQAAKIARKALKGE